MFILVDKGKNLVETIASLHFEGGFEKSEELMSQDRGAQAMQNFEMQ